MSFTDPFPGLSKPLKENDLIRAMRLDLAAEQDAVSLYSAHKDATDNVMVATMLQEVIDDERTHIGIFQTLINTLTEDEPELNLKGAYEVEKKFPNLKYKPGGYWKP